MDRTVSSRSVRFESQNDVEKDKIQTMILKTIVEISGSRWNDASRVLWEMTNWLVNKVIHEGESMNISLGAWHSLNEAWLYFLCRTGEEIKTNTSHPSITEIHLEMLGQDIIGWCDQLEKYGLVDYEMGFWEERILEVMRYVLTLLKTRKVTTST
ncbi:hypothetical protein T552_02354 [Pneumocystis carinii B80]|uniref:Uncharacterized protein n=1 Tax=Pneumocystis carinii (strain B80) TaxID=1408658 RepID=A0A0W4ZG75_PNEC8|nr:hypothetical protein T552_02354 [Pneumocystis carinii B80]KTW27375.1 hypothetical protein T552_02354 [Pneumocystis carinii B80]